MRNGLPTEDHTLWEQMMFIIVLATNNNAAPTALNSHGAQAATSCICEWLSWVCHGRGSHCPIGNNKTGAVVNQPTMYGNKMYGRNGNSPSNGWVAWRGT